MKKEWISFFKSIKEFRFTKKSVKKLIIITISCWLIGTGAGLLQLSMLGADPFSCMNWGISDLIGMGYGNWQLIVNILILIVVFFCSVKHIGYGTVANMILVGYSVQFTKWVAGKMGETNYSYVTQGVLLGVGILLLCAAVAFYMECNMGMAPYDSVAEIIDIKTNGKFPFAVARIVTDIICVAIGCVSAYQIGALWKVVGIGTVIMAFMTGPIVKMFRDKVAKPILK